MYWENDIETMPRETLEGLQLERLRKSVAQASASVFYGDRFKEIGLDPSGITSVSYTHLRAHET